MSWLERIDEREARRVAKAIAAGAVETRDLAEDHLTQFAKQARAIAEPRLHEAAERLRAGAILPLLPLCAGLAPDVAWPYLERAADAVERAQLQR